MESILILNKLKMTFKLSSKLLRRSFFFKRLFDILFSTIALIILLTPLAIIYIAILCTSYFPIIYWSDRVGKNNVVFKMPKFRSMTKVTPLLPKEKLKRPDKWLTPLGALLRKTSLDELPQLWCVLKGEMSLVGPRPNVKRETDLYTKAEKNLLRIRPGITDFASIIFSDESEILKNVDDPDISYNQLIRPWKSRLGLFYIKKQSIQLDILIIIFTILSFFYRDISLILVNRTLKKLNAPQDLCNFSLRKDKLKPTSPPGSNAIVLTREA